MPGTTALHCVPRAPGALPGLGHLVQFVRDPLGFLDSLPREADLLAIRLGPTRLVMVCDPDLTRQVLVNDRLFDKGGVVYERGREIAGDSLITASHSEHRRLRRMCQPSFHPSRLAAYAVLMNEQITASADGWNDGQVIDANEQMTRLAVRMSLETMFGGALAGGIHDALRAGYRGTYAAPSAAWPVRQRSTALQPRRAHRNRAFAGM